MPCAIGFTRSWDAISWLSKPIRNQEIPDLTVADFGARPGLANITYRRGREMANTDDTQDGMGSGCGGCLGIIAIAFVVVVVIGIFTEDPAEDSSTNTPSVTDLVTAPAAADPEGESVASPCIRAFATAAAVSEYSDTREDLFPAYSACGSIDEWKEAYALHPNAIDGGSPEQHAMTVCADNQAELGETPICQAVNAPPPAQPSLKASGQTGLLGVPLPAGARLTERIRGNPAEYTDPSETYAISATADEITAFFNEVMPNAGWYKSATGMFIEFLKGDLVLGVWISENKFTLMGS